LVPSASELQQKKKKKEGDNSVAAVAFFVALQQNEKKKVTVALLSSPSTLQNKPRKKGIDSCRRLLRCATTKIKRRWQRCCIKTKTESDGNKLPLPSTM